MSPLLAALLAFAARAEPPLPRPASPPTPGTVHASPDGRLRWVEGETHVQARNPGRTPKRLRLPPLASGSSRRLLFADGGKFFCVVDSLDREIGLHLGLKRGPRSAKAVLLRSTLRLMDDSGRVLWTKDTPDATAVGRLDDARALRAAADGTLAIVLQDVDPYSKEKPFLWVVKPNGREVLRLDYQSWSRVDEFALSPDGVFLAVRGGGQLPEAESWGRALGTYRLGSEKVWLGEDPTTEPPGLLKTVDAKGWACCLRSGPSYLAWDASGQKRKFGPAEMRRSFGVDP